MPNPYVSYGMEKEFLLSRSVNTSNYFTALSEACQGHPGLLKKCAEGFQRACQGHPGFFKDFIALFEHAEI